MSEALMCTQGPHPSSDFLQIGAPNYESADDYGGFNLISGPASFGFDVYMNPGSGSGDRVGFNGVDPQDMELDVPAGYVSGTVLLDSMTFYGLTLHNLGLAPGTYTWTWGSGADADSFVLNISTTPVPAALPLLAGGLGALGLFGWRRKRKACAARSKQVIRIWREIAARGGLSVCGAKVEL
jgi:hypothetical protein